MLVAVHVAIALHIVHWRLAGRTLAPLELNEVMVTLELGIVTAGFVLMAGAMLATFVFGRFFCSWGCHVLALQDLAAWLLERVGIRPRPIRSRALLLVPPAAMLYMFVWPRVARLIGEQWPAALPYVGVRPPFEWRIAGDAQGWASFVTTDFWRNLPGPWITVLSFLVCGFVIVYILGSRSFCRYGCPYGAAFALADRAAPGRIVLAGDCTACGLCTANCQSGIRVHEEIREFGKVVSPSCLKDLDCVGACPTTGLRFAFRKPAGFASLGSVGRRIARSGLGWVEELTIAVTFVVTFITFRGLYGAVPFLMSLGLGAAFAGLALIGLRLARRDSVSFHGRALKRSGRWTRAGISVAGVMAACAIFLVHSAYIRHHEARLETVLAELRSGAAPGQRTERLIELRDGLEILRRRGLVRPPDLEPQLAAAHLELGALADAEGLLRSVLRREPGDHETRFHLARVLAARGSIAAARSELDAVLAEGEPALAARARHLLRELP